MWQSKIVGEIRGLGKLGENIVVFSVDDYLKSNHITALIISKSNGKEIAKKDIYQNTTGFQIELKVENKPDGSFHSLIVRSTNYKGSANFKLATLEDQSTTSKLEMIFVDENLNAKNITLKLSIAGDIFCGSIVNKSGDVFIASASNQSLSVFQVGVNGEEKAKLSSPLNYQYDNIECELTSAGENDNKIFLAAKYSPAKKDYAFKVFCFDFAAKKAAASNEQMLDKSYQKNLQLEHIKKTFSGDAKTY